MFTGIDTVLLTFLKMAIMTLMMTMMMRVMDFSKKKLTPYKSVKDVLLNVFHIAY